MDIEQKSPIERGKLDTTKIHFQEFFNNIPDIITIITFENRQPGHFKEINKSGLEKLGYTRDEFLKLRIEDLIDPEIRLDLPKDSYKIKNGKNYFETEFVTKNGEIIPVEVSNSLFQIDNKDVILSIARDISERKKIEDALRESEEFNRSIVASSPDCIKVLDLEGNLLMMTDGGQNLMEVDDESCILNTNLIDFYADEFQPDARKAIIRAREGKTAQFTAYCPTLKGTPKWWDVILSPILDADGKPEKLSAVSRDITARKIADEKLRWSKDRLMMGMDMANMVYWEYETENDLFTFDDQFYALYGTSAEEEGGNMISGQEYTKRFVDPGSYEIMEKEFAKTFEADDPDFLSTPQHWMIRADGERRFLQVHFRIMYDEKGNKIGTRGVNQDITELKIAEDKLKLNQDLLLMSMDMAKLVKWEYNIENDLFTFDDHFYTLYGTNAQEQGGYKMSSAEYINRFVPPEEKEFVEKESANVLEKDNPDIISTIQHGIVRSDGERRFISFRLKGIYNENNKKIGNMGVTQDITEIKKVEEELQESIEEKEMLLKEIHHRVKNNLMIISSLLNLQANHLKDQKSIDIFKESQNRAKSMALIHEKLYQSKDLKSIGFKEYITTLSKDLYQNYVKDPSRVSLQLNIEDVDIDIDQAIPLGLILNEIITNSMKYGFTGDIKGKVFIDLSKKGEDYILRVGDDGVGIPSDLDFRKTSSLGMQLIEGLTSQIDGNIELNRENGTEFVIKFKEKKIGK